MGYREGNAKKDIYIIKKEISQINNLMFYLKELEKENRLNSKLAEEKDYILKINNI